MELTNFYVHREDEALQIINIDTITAIMAEKDDLNQDGGFNVYIYFVDKDNVELNMGRAEFSDFIGVIGERSENQEIIDTYCEQKIQGWRR